MSNSSTLSMTEKQTYRRRTVMGALATGSGFAALGRTAFQEDGDEDSDTPTADEIQSFVGVLSGGGNDSGGLGCVQFVPVERGLLWQLVIDNIECITQAHVHAGPVDEDGSLVTPLVEYTGSPDGNGEGTPRSTRPDGLLVEQGFLEDESLREDIRDRPTEHYVTLHTVHNPDGEIRSQLLDAEGQRETEPLPTEFVVSDLDPSEVTVTQGDSIDVTATIENQGDITATQTVELRIDGDTVADRTVDLTCRESETVRFQAVDTTDLDPGEYEYGIVTQEVSATGTLTVETAEEDGSPDDGQGSSADNSESGSGEDTDGRSTDGSDPEPEDDSSTGTLSISEPSEEDPSEFVVVDMTPQNTTMTEGEFFELSGSIENTGGTTGTHFVEMEASIASDAREVEIGPGKSETVTFTDSDTGGFPTGEHLLAIATPHDGMTGTLTIEAADENPGGDSNGNGTD